MKLGFGFSATGTVAGTSATQVQALRQASKNILYTIANSGHYANGDPNGGMDNMTKTFIRECSATSNRLKYKQLGEKYGKIGTRELGETGEKACI